MQTKIEFNEKIDTNKLYLAYANILYNNPLFKAKIFEFCNYDIKRVFEINKDDLVEFSSNYKNITIPRNFLSQLKEVDPLKIYEKIIKDDIKYITYEDENYPILLKEIEDFPIVLFYRGSFKDINFEKTLAIVGSRKATESAKQNVSSIVSGFKNTDVTVISGLAEGIDAMAHISALENNIKTVAVIGSGLNYKYPSVNSKLYTLIEENGLILSEFPNDLKPVPQNFPQRNRIVTGLSKGTLIAEAKMKSGAMISARLTLEQNRELMCIPGLITNPNCEGVYHLIKNGAGVVTKTEDILNILNWEKIKENKTKLNLSGLDKQIYDLISSEEISYEGLQQKLDVGINELMVKLTEMELNGLIIQKNGLYYISGN